MSGVKLPGLEALRGFAALYVFAHHARLAPNSGWGMLLYFGQEAVILFFLLSGFVIDHSTRGRSVTAKRYLIHRFRRIYPIFLVALFLAYLAACVSARELVPVQAVQLLGNILMMQDVASLKPGVWVDTYRGNSALWSLSYEWWFYMGFIPLSLWAADRKASRFPLVWLLSLLGAGSYLLLPNQLSLFLGYFVIWWAGVELSRDYSAAGFVARGTAMKIIGGLLALALVWSIPLVGMSGAKIALGTSPFLQVRHFLAAAAFVGIAYGWSMIRFRGFFPLMRPFCLIAPVSYFLYACHLPLIQIARQAGLFEAPWLGALLTLGAALALGWIVEVRIQRAINQVMK
ncbi:acyltransferase [Caenimonas koreensis]|uniref:Acyltransferase family protein n=1 Tax=Caenimonas koreensis DSM 17982 TaxID=1121255 RepID=A0A844AWW8_9BURK|nr:acyltransferase [Caenimonas koreensis]MRD46858.1 acyltransferase family protein [Caenimonas koreensis DSM 17982]